MHTTMAHLLILWPIEDGRSDRHHCTDGGDLYMRSTSKETGWPETKTVSDHSCHGWSVQMKHQTMVNGHADGPCDGSSNCFDSGIIMLCAQQRPAIHMQQLICRGGSSQASKQSGSSKCLQPNRHPTPSMKLVPPQRHTCSATPYVSDASKVLASWGSRGNSAMRRPSLVSSPAQGRETVQYPCVQLAIVACCG